MCSLQTSGCATPGEGDGVQHWQQHNHPPNLHIGHDSSFSLLILWQQGLFFSIRAQQLKLINKTSGCASFGKHDVQCCVPGARRGSDGEHALHPHVGGHGQVPGEGQQRELPLPVTTPGWPPDANECQPLASHPHAQSTSKSYTGKNSHWPTLLN